MITRVRAQRNIDIICFTGFTLEQLQQKPPHPHMAGFLSEIDVLIDGRYVDALNDDRGLRGSSNQHIHHLSQRLVSTRNQLLLAPRQTEMHTTSTGVAVIGVLPKDLNQRLDKLV